MSSSYLLKTQARSLVAHAADEDNHGFLVGTANLKGANEVGNAATRRCWR